MQFHPFVEAYLAGTRLASEFKPEGIHLLPEIACSYRNWIPADVLVPDRSHPRGGITSCRRLEEPRGGKWTAVIENADQQFLRWRLLLFCRGSLPFVSLLRLSTA